LFVWLLVEPRLVQDVITLPRETPEGVYANGVRS